MRKCKICKRSNSAWSMQFVASETPSFTLPGNHYRGFPTFPVCDTCKDKISRLTPDAASYLVKLALEG